MKTKILPLLALLLPAIASLSAVPSGIKTKIGIQAAAANNFLKDAPAYIVYPEGNALKTFEESGAIENLERSIEKMGYSLVSKDSDAVVFIRVDFDEGEPYSTEIGIKERPKVDYSNSAASANYAAMLPGGRYTELANPQQNRQNNEGSSILGPSGEVIVVGEQEDRAPKIIESERQTLQTTIYPLNLKISAWTFEETDGNLQPTQLWAVLASYNNLRDEESQPQLRDLCETASRYFGKNLKKEKYVSR